MTIVDVWITCPDVETARAIATAVIEERLAACANLYPGIEVFTGGKVRSNGRQR